MNSTIHLIGINHRAAAVDVREKFALTNFCSPETWAIPAGEGVRESLILSTCNRVEVLVVGDGDEPRRRALQCWASARGRTVDELEPYLYQYKDDEAVRHLFSVASSLDSRPFGHRRYDIRTPTATRYNATTSIRPTAHTHLHTLDTYLHLLLHGTDARYGIATIHTPTYGRLQRRRDRSSAHGVARGNYVHSAHCRTPCRACSRGYSWAFGIEYYDIRACAIGLYRPHHINYGDCHPSGAVRCGLRHLPVAQQLDNDCLGTRRP